MEIRTNVEWDTDYDLGIEVIDQQHKKILVYLNELAEAIENGNTEEVLKKVVDNLVKYTYSHLEHEEKLFIEMGQDEFKSHIQEHDRFRKTISEMQESVKTDGETVQPAVELHSMLYNWLFNHIQGTDKKYVPLFKKFGY